MGRGSGTLRLRERGFEVLWDVILLPRGYGEMLALIFLILVSRDLFSLSCGTEILLL